jgi:putative hydrolase of the HAD superfamily
MTDSIKAIAFDFGNTLCAWDEPQYRQVTLSTLQAICAAVPGLDVESAYGVFSRIRNEHCARELPRMHEVDLTQILAETAKELRGAPLSDSEMQGVIEAHLRAFVGACRLSPGLHALMERLSRRYRLAVLSNYSMSECIRLSLRELGLDKHLERIIVSADLGVIKPSRRIFAELLDAMGLPPQNVLFVGDDWVADVVGACASGMACVQIANGSVGSQVLDNVFGVYLRKALESPELSCWAEAKPVAVMKSVLELERWLEDRNT